MYIILAMIILSFVLVFNGLYFYFKFQKALLVFQQGGYDNTRMFNYIKKHYKYCSGINELCLFIPIIIMLIDHNLAIISLLLMFFFSYYNLRFYNLNAKRYTKKLKLNYTKRLKRLIITFCLIVFLIVIFSIYVLNYYHIDFLNLYFYITLYTTYILVTYIIFELVILANIINKPIETMVKNYYKKMAMKKLSAMPNLEVIGITGSFGKTSTKNIVQAILQEQAPTLSTPASFNTPMGLCITIDKELTPLYKYFIAEMGAYRVGEIKELVTMVKPKYGIVTSVGSQHLETFKSIDNVLKTKMELIECLPYNGLGIINIDNEYIRDYQIKNNVKIKTYSLFNQEADIYTKELTYTNNGMEFVAVYNQEEIPIKTRLLGKYNVENILAGILLAKHLHLSNELIIHAISKIRPVKNRLELKPINQETIIIDDAFNANEMGIKEAINILGNFKDYQRILITPGLIDLGARQKSIHQDLGKYLTDFVDLVYIIGDENYEYIIDGIKQTDFDLKQVIHEDNFIQAYNKAMNTSGKKVILIANDLPDKFNN